MRKVCLSSQGIGPRGASQLVRHACARGGDGNSSCSFLISFRQTANALVVCLEVSKECTSIVVLFEGISIRTLERRRICDDNRTVRKRQLRKLDARSCRVKDVWYGESPSGSSCRVTFWHCTLAGVDNERLFEGVASCRGHMKDVSCYLGRSLDIAHTPVRNLFYRQIKIL